MNKKLTVRARVQQLAKHNPLIGLTKKEIIKLALLCFFLDLIIAAAILTR